MSPRTVKTFLFWIAIAAAVVFGAVIRVQHLGDRPMHGDEANQAVKTGQLLETGEYIYDPHDHHGPTLYYAAAAVAKLRGESTLAETDAWTYRLVPVAFGIALLLVGLLMTDGLGRGTVAVSTVLLAISPAFSYYSRYFIQEMSLVFFTALLIAAGWRYVCVNAAAPQGVAPTPRSIAHWRWALIAGAAVGLMHATKETCVLAFTAIGCAFVATLIWNRLRDGAPFPSRNRHLVIHSAAALGVAAAISIVLFSAFFTHARGPLDSILTYGNYLHRAEGAGMHDKPWYYYLQVLLYWKRGLGEPWSEGPVVVLALVGIVFAVFGRSTQERSRTLPRFVAFYTLALTIGYALIPYKTPWSMLSFYFGMVVLAGYGVSELWAVGKTKKGVSLGVRTATAALTAASILYLAWGSHRANVLFPADTRNPYVYAHTSSAFLRLADRLEDLAAVSPKGHDLLIAVVDPTGDYWPIPYYTRRFPNVGYFAALPDGLHADLIITPNPMARAVSEQITGYTSENHSLRPGRLLTVFIRQELWDAFMATRQ